MEPVGHEGKLVISVTAITMQSRILTCREAGVETWQSNKKSPVLNLHHIILTLRIKWGVAFDTCTVSHIGAGHFFVQNSYLIFMCPVLQQGLHKQF